MFTRLIVALVALVAIGCTLACEPDPVVATEADEPAIWTAALTHERGLDGDAAPFLVDETADALTEPFDVDDLAAQLPDVDATTLASFDARAHDAQPLGIDAPEGFTLVGVDDAPVATPDAPIVSLSRAGFGPDEALVYIEVFCGNVCANGRLFVLARSDGVWSVTTTFDLWAS